MRIDKTHLLDLLSLKMNFIFKMPDAILLFYVAEAHR
jgi:hypothetical protein